MRIRSSSTASPRPELHLSRKAFSTNRGLWSLQGPAVQWGQDFAFPLPQSFSRDNYLGHIQDGEGGGIPIVYFWDDLHGLALMHMDANPRDWYMPVTASGQGVTAAFELRQRVELQPGQTLTSLPVVLSSHHGDFFQPVALYRDLLAGQGVQSPEPVSADYEPAWCSWGYEFDVRPEEMTGVLPKLHEMGIRWLTLDDRWFDAYGDWNPRRDTFPNGADDLRRMNAVIHDAGSFTTLWWYPLCVEDGHGRWDSHVYELARLFLEHPDWLVLNADGTVARNNRHLAMLCPALPAVRESIAALTRRFITDWGFDGHKLDNIYTMPACYNPRHNHHRPEESTEAMAEAYRIIFTLTRELKPNSVTQICPCGTPITPHLLPFTDQTVTADPTSSAQIRQRIKFYKALVGPRAAVFADHVELSDGGIDFASEIGPGGVPGTKFVWPEEQEVKARVREDWGLTRQNEALFEKWFRLYHDHQLAAGEYLDLYDLAFDRPEAHAISQGDVLYYAFFAEFDGLALHRLDHAPRAQGTHISHQQTTPTGVTSAQCMDRARLRSTYRSRGRSCWQPFLGSRPREDGWMDERGTYTREEILSQPAAWIAALDVLKARKSELASLSRGGYDQVLFTGCGSTYYLSLAAAALFQHLTGKPARAFPASELWLYPRACYSAGKTLLVAVSRSGETTETLAACESFPAEARGDLLTFSCYPERKLASMGRVNVVLESGQEQSIAQTRAFTTLFLGTVALAALWSHDEALLSGLDLLAGCGARTPRALCPSCQTAGARRDARSLLLARLRSALRPCLRSQPQDEGDVAIPQ